MIFALQTPTGLRVRANTFYQKGTLSAAYRLISRKVPDLAALGTPEVLQCLLARQRGLILITGPAGSGKTTTIAGMINLINEKRACHIITIEDPIEFVHTNQRAIIDQREIEKDTLTFADALHCVLRQAPDVIVIGEMRDYVTASAAVAAAETGHLVTATLHTNDAIQAVDRMLDLFPPEQEQQLRAQLAFTLLGVFAQQLVPRRDGAGRVPATEVLLVNRAVAAHIRDGKTHMARTVIDTSRQEGMLSMDEALKRLYLADHITYEELASRVSNPDFLASVPRVRRGARPNMSAEPATPEPAGPVSSIAGADIGEG